MKQKLIYIALCIIGLGLISCGPAAQPATNSEQETTTEETAPEAMAPESNPADPEFQQAVNEFNEVYKKALFTTGQKKTEEAQQSTPKSLQMWQDIVAKYGDTPPTGYQQSADWSGTLNEILILEEKAANLVDQGEFVEAHENLEQVRKTLRSLRQENNVTHISDFMLTFHDEMELVVEAPSLEEAQPHIDKLVEYIEPIKTHSDNPDYQAEVSKLTNLVTQLANAETEEAFKEAQSKIRPAFIQLYLQYG